MESTCTVQVQDLDNKASDIIEDCLRNAVAVTKILEHFSNPQLLKLSLVNKLWNYEARGMIRQRSNIIARLDHNGPCQDIQAFAASLRLMKMVPFSGMRMVLPNTDESCQCKTSALDHTDDLLVLDPLPFKTMSVQLPSNKWNLRCRMSKKILRDISSVLEELTLHTYFATENIIEEYVQECSFPRLRILKLKETHRCQVTGEDYMNYVKALMSRAPNLQELHSDRPLRVQLELVEGSSVVPVCSYKICAPFDEITADVMNSALRVQSMGLVCITGGPRFGFGRLNRILPMILQSACTRTLCEMTVDAVLAVPLMCYGIQLENVRKLTMCINYHELKLRKLHGTLRFLKCFDFTRILPNVTKVYITKGDFPRLLPAGLKTFTRETNVSEPAPDRAANINELHLQDRVLDSKSAQFFAKMFPNIERLYVESLDEEDVFMRGAVFEHWVNLRELHIKSNCLQDTANFDCVFCGIFFDEVVQLMQKDEEYLKKVNVVPVKPSIACLKNLRVLNLNYDLKRRPEPIIYDATNPMFFLSKITGLIALARCPNLAVTLKISPDGAQAREFSKIMTDTVSHLKPYLSIEQ